MHDRCASPNGVFQKVPMMTDFAIHPQLINDCVLLGRFSCSYVLLMNNAGAPWIILVPQNTVGATELIDLPHDEQQQLLQEVNLAAGIVKAQPGIEKLNIAALGNIVPQLHLHIVGRSPTDYCWPKLVWASDPGPRYEDEAIAEWRDLFSQVAGFSAASLGA